MVPPDDALSFPITAITALSQNITRMPLSPLLHPSPPYIYGNAMIASPPQIEI